MHPELARHRSIPEHTIWIVQRAISKTWRAGRSNSRKVRWWVGLACIIAR